MSLWKIAWKSIRQRRLSSVMTGLSMALGVALVIAVLVIHGAIENTFTRSAQGYHLIVGAKGGKLQLVLNTVYHLSTPIENVPFWYYEEFTQGRYKPFVRAAIPYCLGDNYEGYRVVGTVPELFTAFEYGQGRQYEFAAGRNFAADHYFEAVVGAQVARRTGLKVGDRFEPTHGISGDDGHKHDAFEVVGILAPTGTPNDRAVFVNMEGFFLLDGHALDKPRERPGAAAAGDEAAHDHAHDDDHADGHHAHDDDHAHDDHAHSANAHDDHAHSDHAHDDHAHDHHDHKAHHGHDHHHHEPLPKELREVTAVLLLLNDDLTMLSLMRAVNKDLVAQAVMPAREIVSLFDGIIGNLRMLLLLLSVLVVVVAGVGIMVAIYNSMSDRRREIAVMRALGARRRTVMAIILAESILLSLAGGAAGVLLGHGLIGLLDPVLVAQTGVSIGFLQFRPIELALIPGLVVLASLVGFLPAASAYRTDVAKALSASP